MNLPIVWVASRRLLEQFLALHVAGCVLVDPDIVCWALDQFSLLRSEPGQSLFHKILHYLWIMSVYQWINKPASNAIVNAILTCSLLLSKLRSQVPTEDIDITHQPIWKSLALWAAAWSSGEFVRASYQLKSRTIPTLPFWAAYVLKILCHSSSENSMEDVIDNQQVWVQLFRKAS